MATETNFHLDDPDLIPAETCKSQCRHSATATTAGCGGRYAITRPSVRPSVRLSVTWVDQSKTIEVRMMQTSPQSSPMTLVS